MKAKVRKSLIGGHQRWVVGSRPSDESKSSCKKSRIWIFLKWKKCANMQWLLTISATVSTFSHLWIGGGISRIGRDHGTGRNSDLSCVAAQWQLPGRVAWQRRSVTMWHAASLTPSASACASVWSVQDYHCADSDPPLTFLCVYALQASPRNYPLGFESETVSES